MRTWLYHKFQQFQNVKSFFTFSIRKLSECSQALNVNIYNLYNFKFGFFFLTVFLGGFQLVSLCLCKALYYIKSGLIAWWCSGYHCHLTARRLWVRSMRDAFLSPQYKKNSVTLASPHDSWDWLQQTPVGLSERDSGCRRRTDEWLMTDWLVDN